MEVDKWATFPKKPSEFILCKFYGNIEYYLTYEFEGEIHMLAYIHWATNVEEDSVGLLSFSKYGAHEFIDACAIDHCVGFFNHNGIYSIIDKEFEYVEI
jgi:hypothetical protein